MKGRDWYDFAWYASRKVKPDLPLLRYALLQQGPLAGQDLRVTLEWYCDNLAAVIRRIDWREARLDVQRFVPASEQPGLDIWGAEFFLYQLEQVRGVLLEA